MPTIDRPAVRRPRIDLLPARVPRARLNKKLLSVFGIALVAAVFLMLAMVGGTAQKLEAAKARRDKAATRAQEVDKVTSEAMQLQSRLAPISDKVKFINQADESGYPYWDRFYEVNEYIAGYAQLLAFAIVADKAPGGPIGDGSPETLYNIAGPGSSADCALLVRVPGGNALARFVLNMTRCPAISDVRFQNAGGGGLFNVNPGFVIRTTMPEIASPIPSGMSGGMAAGASAGGAGRGMGMMGGAPGGMPGGGPSAMPGAGGGPGGGMMMGGAGGGMPGAAGGSAGGASTQQSGLVYTVPIMQARPDLSFSDVYLVVTGKLARPIKVPQPPGIGGAAPAAGGAAGGGMMGGMPGAGGAGGAMMPGAAGAGPGGASGSAGAKSDDKSGKADSSKASKASTKSDSGEE